MFDVFCLSFFYTFLLLLHLFDLGLPSYSGLDRGLRLLFHGPSYSISRKFFLDVYRTIVKSWGSDFIVDVYEDLPFFFGYFLFFIEPESK